MHKLKTLTVGKEEIIFSVLHTITLLGLYHNAAVHMHILRWSPSNYKIPVEGDRIVLVQNLLGT